MLQPTAEAGKRNDQPSGNLTITMEVINPLVF